MNDYFARRSAELQGTLDRIDIATAPRCMTCGHMMRPDDPSDLFCSVTCHNTGLRWTADPDAVTDDPVDAWEWRGATTRAQTEKRDRYRRHFRQQPYSGDTLPTVALLDELQSCRREREWFQRVHLNRPTGAVLRAEIRDGLDGPIVARPNFTIRPGGARISGSYLDEVPALQVDFDALREAFRAMTTGLVTFMDQWSQTIRGAMPLIEAITDNSEQFNRHVRMPADDPRRAILHHVQNRGTGPAETPFKNRGRR